VNRFIFWPLTFILIFVLNLWVQDFFSFLGFSPRLLLLATLFFAVKEGPLTGECLGFLWGLLLDLAGQSHFGSQTFLLTAVGYSCGVLRGKIDETIFLAQISLVWGASFLFILGLFFLEVLFGGEPGRFLVWNSLLEPLLAGVVAPLYFFILNRWYKLGYERN